MSTNKDDWSSKFVSSLRNQKYANIFILLLPMLEFFKRNIFSTIIVAHILATLLSASFTIVCQALQSILTHTKQNRSIESNGDVPIE